MKALATLAAIFFAGPAVALDPGDRFHLAFNRAAQAQKVEIKASPSKCDSSSCEFDLSPRGRAYVGHSGRARVVDEIAGYFDPDPRGVLDALGFLSTVMDMVSADQTAPARMAAKQTLLREAAGPRRDGEVHLGKWRYVMRPSDGRDVRIYVTKIR